MQGLQSKTNNKVSVHQSASDAPNDAHLFAVITQARGIVPGMLCSTRACSAAALLAQSMDLPGVQRQRNDTNFRDCKYREGHPHVDAVICWKPEGAQALRADNIQCFLV